MNSATVADQQLIDTIYQLYQEVRELKERVSALENRLQLEPPLPTRKSLAEWALERAIRKGKTITIAGDE